MPHPQTVEWIINYSVVINGILYGNENKGNTAHMTPSMNLTSTRVCNVGLHLHNQRCYKSERGLKELETTERCSLRLGKDHRDSSNVLLLYIGAGYWWVNFVKNHNLFT